MFRGTRVPVHLVAELVAQGTKPAELIDSYPRLNAEMIRLAPVYGPPIRCAAGRVGSHGTLHFQYTGRDESCPQRGSRQTLYGEMSS